MATLKEEIKVEVDKIFNDMADRMLRCSYYNIQKQHPRYGNKRITKEMKECEDASVDVFKREIASLFYRLLMKIHLNDEDAYSEIDIIEFSDNRNLTEEENKANAETEKIMKSYFNDDPEQWPWLLNYIDRIIELDDRFYMCQDREVKVE